MIKLTIHYKNDSGDGARINFKGNPTKAIALLDILKAHIENSSDINTTIEDIVQLEIEKTT